ncbi:pyruvate dehydrogenase (acetyl-transferring), homodimeric type [Azoarcus sp. L1K30]|uniref:pyruvate dehydrogenase (acetyl-transferring), homodimeric type n=1 Tax=Azoarcus sp. L1K30 TaxID=2820277 RepID=UPI001B81AC86|nr:pyruvate dehydrogenase (acetyl-transferring), homodimeric type [Azoarcus sp. L1K30]MBR0565564.1 pyruvate dehydrogenase (acetyl-transferring), homodimeric type [Azoarcus sp. L1K30]
MTHNPSPMNLNTGSDNDADETRDWLDSLAEVVERDGLSRAEYLVGRLIESGRRAGGRFHTRHTTPYRNTIGVDAQPPYPGDIDMEARITAIHRWNALAMVSRANKAHAELGGHIATYASIADLFEVGFNHFFRGRTEAHPGDLVYFQAHASPGVYARAFLEGRLSEDRLEHFRREVSGGIGRGLSSYPHPTLMPDFWQFPTGSMGLGLISAIYQARFQRYQTHRGIAAPSDRRVWAFVGDGEMDEPESLAGISLAAREQLDNMVLVVNCNLQRLDGPVRGNGNVVQELETLFAGAGWNVIKCLWGSNWDVLFARDREGWILKRMAEAVDGEFQKLSATDGHYNREHFFSRYPELAALVANMSDQEIDSLKRGGHDPSKIYAAYAAAAAHRGQPTVILAQTTKGYGMGASGQGANTSHQTKKLARADLERFRERFGLPLSDQDLDELRYFHPGENSPELRYLQARRAALGGYVPTRNREAKPITLSQPDLYVPFHADSGEREISTTMTLVRLLNKLMRDSQLGPRIVPVVADEARTFGMQDMFRQFGIYSPWGQQYTPQDSDQLAFYREDVKGQILEEGITEAGSMASWIAAGTAYSHSDEPMLPFYIFYSMFGFQRVADLIWNAADSQARGFLLGATAGRTTLSGEGLQHEDGQSHIYAATIPTCRAYDPAFGYEVAVIVEDGVRRMMSEADNGFYYITLYNENYAQPAMPVGAEEGIRRGLYRLRSAPADDRPRVQLIGSGSILRQVIAAADLLEQDFGIAADVWSATSFGELRKDGIDCDRWNLLHPDAPRREPWVTTQLAGHGPVVAATDFVRSYADLIRNWVPGRYTVLGTDGFGRSDTRVALRDFFEVDARYIALAAIQSLVSDGALPADRLDGLVKRLGIDADKPSPLGC